MAGCHSTGGHVDDNTNVYLWQEGQDVDYEEEFDGEVLSCPILIFVHSEQNCIALGWRLNEFVMHGRGVMH
jgi:hypothetical protein